MYELMWPLFGVSIFLAAYLISVLASYLRNKNRIRQQEMIHRERLAAIEKGTPLPEWDKDMLSEEKRTTAYMQTPGQQFRWFRYVSLCVGLFLSLGGFGMFWAFVISEDNELAEMASIGFIPMMAGVGLLLFYFLTKKERLDPPE